MIKSLHRRLALLMILVIGAILICASGAALLVSERQLTLREETTFLSRFNSLAHDVRMERNVQHAQLAKLEAADMLVMTVYDGGQPISFQGGWQPLTPRAELFERALEAANRAGVPLTGGTPETRYAGELRGNKNERYLVCVQTFISYRQNLAVVMLKDMSVEDAQRAQQRLVFLIITLCAMAAMSAFGWLFTARAVRPIEAAHINQNAFIAAASHELRTPLQVMQSSLDALKGGPKDPLRFTSAMQGELNRMGRLTQNLMLLTSVDEGAAAQYGPVELAELVSDVVQDHMVFAAERQIELYFSEPSSTPLACGDALTLRLAINVLVDNAICYIQPCGHIDVSIESDARWLIISVSDDGPGIDPEHQPHIFERFYRADKSRQDRSHSGLGLCIAQQIITQHGGKLSFESAKPHGCIFSIRLPRI